MLTDRALAAELAQERYQLVLANIVADVIIPWRPRCPACWPRAGVFLCSGIIDSRAHEVEEGPGPQRPAGDPEAGAERLGCSGGSPGLKRKVS